MGSHSPSLKEQCHLDVVCQFLCYIVMLLVCQIKMFKHGDDHDYHQEQEPTFIFSVLPKKIKTVLFGKVFPNVWTHPSTPGFLWDFGKVKFGSKMAIFGVIGGFGPQSPHPTTFGKAFPNKTSFFGRLSLALHDKTQCLEQILILSKLTIMIRKLLDAHAHLLYL